MPLVGTVCCLDGRQTDFETCLSRCRGRGCEYPLPLIMSMSKNGENRKNAGISATTILQCPRLTILQEEYDYFEPPSEYHARWRGTGVHAMAESGGPIPGIIQERRIRRVLHMEGGDDLEITGQPDWWDVVNEHLDDWKSTGVCPIKPYDDHCAQLNIYAWLVDGGAWMDTGEISTGTVRSASIVYIDPKRSVTLPVELWNETTTEKFIRRRLAPMVHYRRTGELPSITELKKKDQWRKRFCPFSGSGLCCADNQPLHFGNEPPVGELPQEPDSNRFEEEFSIDLKYFINKS